MSSVFLFVFYFVILLWILTWLLKRSQTGISRRMGIFVFSFKVLMGCCYGYVFLAYYGGDDPWKFYQDSLIEYHQLIHHPFEFFKDFLPGPYFARAHSLSQGWAQYVQELEYLLMVKFLAICNIFSRKNYYVDILLFDFVLFWGPFLFFKLLSSVFPKKKKILLICIFFIPSITFWISGIRAEGLLLLFLGLILFHMHQWHSDRRFYHLGWVLVGFAGFLIFRGQFLLAFLPAFGAWLLSYNRVQKAGSYFMAVYLIVIGIFFTSMLISKEKNLSIPLIKRQKEFMDLHGNTRLSLDTLRPSPSSFVKAFPEAFTNSMTRPWPWEASGTLQWISVIEIIAFWLLVILLVIAPEKEYKKILLQPLLLIFLFYGLSQILLIGYIVPFPGAIVRYKAIPELLLVLALCLAINWDKIIKLK